MPRHPIDPPQTVRTGSGTAARTRWATGQLTADAKHALVVRVRPGYIARDYTASTRLDNGKPVFMHTIVASEHQYPPWLGTWTPTDVWRTLPGIQSAKWARNFAQNGSGTATVLLDNITFPEQTGTPHTMGASAVYHTIKRGFFSPSRGVVVTARPDLWDDTGWTDALNGGYQIELWEGYGSGEEIVPLDTPILQTIGGVEMMSCAPDDGAISRTWTGIIETVDLESHPDHITLTARDFGILFTDQRLQGDNKAREMVAPITFADHAKTCGIRPVGKQGLVADGRTIWVDAFTTDDLASYDSVTGPVSITGGKLVATGTADMTVPLWWQGGQLTFYIDSVSDVLQSGGFTITVPGLFVITATPTGGGFGQLGITIAGGTFSTTGTFDGFHLARVGVQVVWAAAGGLTIGPPFVPGTLIGGAPPVREIWAEADGLTVVTEAQHGVELTLETGSYDDLSIISDRPVNYPGAVPQAQAKVAATVDTTTSSSHYTGASSTPFDGPDIWVANLQTSSSSVQHVEIRVSRAWNAQDQLDVLDDNGFPATIAAGSQVYAGLGAFRLFTMTPLWSGCEMWVSVYLEGDDMTMDGKPMAAGWVDVGAGSTPDSIPFLLHAASLDAASPIVLDLGHVFDTNDVYQKLDVGWTGRVNLSDTPLAGVKLRLTFRNLQTGAPDHTPTTAHMSGSDLTALDTALSGHYTAGVENFWLFAFYPWAIGLSTLDPAPEPGNYYLTTPPASVRGGVGSLAPINTVDGTLAGDVNAVHWVLVSDAIEIIETLCMWAGFKEWNLEWFGWSIVNPMQYGSDKFLIDAVNDVLAQGNFVFFMEGPTDADESIGIPTFVHQSAVDDPPDDMIEVTHETLLETAEVKWDLSGLPGVLRYRGDPVPPGLVGATFEEDLVETFMATYFPPWAGSAYSRLDGTPSTPLPRTAGVVRHFTQTIGVNVPIGLGSNEECLFACLLAAIQYGISMGTGQVQVPGLDAFGLNQQISVIDEADGINSRMWVASIESNHQMGPTGKWTMVIGGSYIDTEDLELIAADYATALASATPQLPSGEGKIGVPA